MMMMMSAFGAGATGPQRALISAIRHLGSLAEKRPFQPLSLRSRNWVSSFDSPHYAARTADSSSDRFSRTTS